MRLVMAHAAVATILGIVFFSHPGLAIQHKYVEDFTTTQYKDTVHTTAWWDTVAGELKLHPFVPALGGTCDTPGNAEGVAVSGYYIFVADNTSGLQVIDIALGASGMSVGSYDTPGLARGIAISGDLAFVGDASSGLQVIDINDPTNPTLVGTCDTPGSAWGVVVSGDYVFVADGTSGLQVIDISDPASPTILGTCDTPSSALGVDVSGYHVFVADYAGGLQVIDISDPANPTLVGYCDTPGLARSVAVSGDNAYVADGSYGLQVIDISDLANPLLVGSFDTSGEAWGVAVSGYRAYVGDSGSGLQMIDISDPANPTLEGTCDTSGEAYGVAISGESAFVADGGSGLQVIRIAQITGETAAVGSCEVYGGANSASISGSYAFVTKGSYGLQVIDMSDPTDPTLVGTCDTPGLASCAVISGNYAFVADWGSGLQVIDIADPTTPTLAGTCDTPGNASGIAVAGDHIFIADGDLGLQVIDISDPTDPTLVGTCDTPGSAYAVAITGDYAVITDGWALRMIDISDPINPVLVGSCDLPDMAYRVVVSGPFVNGNFALVANGSAGLVSVDISDPLNPAIYGDYPYLENFAVDIAISGHFVFVADPNHGILTFYLSIPSGTPGEPIIHQTSSGPYSVAVSGDYALAGASGTCFVIPVFQNDVDSGRWQGMSLAVDSADDAIIRARLVSTQTDSVQWYLKTTEYFWQEVASNGNWLKFAHQGSDLRWESFHTWFAPGVNPTVSHLEIDWLYEAACVDSIVDVSDDQGGWVLANFTRSGLDFADEATLPISSYGIWRRVNDTALVAALESHALSTADRSDTAEEPDFGDLPVVIYQGDTYVRPQPGLQASSFPPGTWVWVATVPAIQQDSYIAAVPTIADSSAFGGNGAVFVITAHTTTPSVWYISGPDSGYSVDNLAPEPPMGVAAEQSFAPEGLQLAWDPNSESDLWYYAVYRGESGDFVPGPGNLIATPNAEGYLDEGWSWNIEYWYKISAVDIHGNESGWSAAGPGDITGDEPSPVPQANYLSQNFPNPFNPMTTIRFGLSERALVSLKVYDAAGRLVAVLVDEERQADVYEEAWDGKDTGGSAVASGVYIYRLIAGDFRETRKMVVLR